MRKQSANSVFLPRFCFKFGTPKMSGNSDIWTQKKMDTYMSNETALNLENLHNVDMGEFQNRVAKIGVKTTISC